MKKLLGMFAALGIVASASQVDARYLEADPLGLVDGPSVYGYAAQNPMRYTDPTGEFIPAVVWGGRAALACWRNPACRAAAGAAASSAYGWWSDEDGCYTTEEFLWDAGLGAAAGGLSRPFLRGSEYGFRGTRFAPFGNRWTFPTRGGRPWQRTWNNSNGKWPHYHRTRPGYGQGKGRHRPWDTRPTDRSFWDRF